MFCRRRSSGREALRSSGTRDPSAKRCMNRSRASHQNATASKEPSENDYCNAKWDGNEEENRENRENKDDCVDDDVTTSRNVAYRVFLLSACVYMFGWEEVNLVKVDDI